MPAQRHGHAAGNAVKAKTTERIGENFFAIFRFITGKRRESANFPTGIAALPQPIGIPCEKVLQRICRRFFAGNIFDAIIQIRPALRRKLVLISQRDELCVLPRDRLPRLPCQRQPVTGM